MIQEYYDEFENNYSRSYESDSGKEIPAYDIPQYNIHAVTTIRLAKGWSEFAGGILVKNKRDFNEYGFEWGKLRKLEYDGFIIIKKLGKNPHNIEIKSTGKNFKYTRGL